MKTPHQIVNEVSEATGVPVSRIMSRWKNRIVVRARWEACWRIRNERGWTLHAIADYLGIDHSTVFAACEKFEELLDTEPGLAERLAEQRTAA